MSFAKCPKCGGSSWYTKDKNDVWQRCLCGLNKLVHTTLEAGISIHHSDKPSQESLPRSGTKLHTCLQAVRATHPGKPTTRDVSQLTGENTSDTASQLTVLMHKGLVERVEERRGVAGGSTWQLTFMAKQILNIR